MALSPQDHTYWEDKLTVMGFLPFFLTTTLIGAIAFPVMLFLMDWSSGSIANWSTHVVVNLMTIGFMFGTILSILMNFIFRFLLWMGWLPSRR
jgi:hypothetical protein